jgi:hypothetical protein
MSELFYKHNPHPQHNGPRRLTDLYKRLECSDAEVARLTNFQAGPATKVPDGGV